VIPLSDVSRFSRARTVIRPLALLSGLRWRSSYFLVKDRPRPYVLNRVGVGLPVFLRGAVAAKQRCSAPSHARCRSVLWSGNPASEDMLKDFGATIRCIPYEQSGTAGRCVLTGASATMDAIFAKAY
jgi:hypothetical protein